MTRNGRRPSFDRVPAAASWKQPTTAIETASSPRNPGRPRTTCTPGLGRDILRPAARGAAHPQITAAKPSLKSPPQHQNEASLPPCAAAEQPPNSSPHTASYQHKTTVIAAKFNHAKKPDNSSDRFRRAMYPPEVTGPCRGAEPAAAMWDGPTNSPWPGG